MGEGKKKLKPHGRGNATSNNVEKTLGRERCTLSGEVKSLLDRL